MDQEKEPGEVGASHRWIVPMATPDSCFPGTERQTKSTGELPRPDAKASIRFLEVFRPGGPWALTVITPDQGKIETRTFSNLSAAEQWISAKNGAGANVYHSVNPLLRPVTSKAKKTDIRGMEYLAVDVDPRVGENLDAERRRIEKLLFEFQPPCSIIVDSGGGYQAYWRLDAEQPVSGDEAKAVELEAYNLELANRLGGDHVQNLDRILRVPGTVNWPDAKKQKKGRVPAPAKVVKEDIGISYSLSAFSPAKRDAASASPPLSSVQIEGPTGPICNLAELDKWGVPARLKAIIVQGEDVDFPKPGDNSRSVWLHDVACNLVRCGVPDNVIFAVITDPDFGISASVLDQRSKAKEYAIRQIAKAKAKVAKDEPSAVPWTAGASDEEDEKPTPTMLAQWWLDGRRSRLIRYDGEWLAYGGGAYLPREDEGIRSEVWRAYPKANSAIVSNIMDAAKGLIHLDKNKVTPPCWLDGRQQPDPDRLLVLRNGMLDLDSGTLMPHTDQMFTRNALDFDYDPAAPKPTRFFQFLNEVWPEQSEQDCHASLQQMFGYLLTPDTSQQKIFVMVGPPRSGKGTIGRLLERILGEPSVCSLTFSSMGTPFGRQSMIGKRLALVSDMRIGKLTDRAAVAETLLTISGEDTVSVPRKHMTDWSGHLPVRFVILSNEPPTLDDPSGALLSRYIILETHQSFRGSEDRTLDDQLAAELPGILNWAIDGWKALQRAGRFVQPANAADMANSITRIGSPIAAFVQDECVLDPAVTVRKDDVYARFKAWCREQDRDHHGNKETFSKGLLVSCPAVKSSKERDGDERYPVYRGIRMRPEPF